MMEMLREFGLSQVGALVSFIAAALSCLSLLYWTPAAEEREKFDPAPFKTADNHYFRAFTYPSEAELVQAATQNNQPKTIGLSGLQGDPIDIDAFKQEIGPDGHDYVSFFIRKDGYQNSQVFQVPVLELKKGAWPAETLNLKPKSFFSHAKREHPFAFFFFPISLVLGVFFLSVGGRENKLARVQAQLLGEAGTDPYQGRFIGDYLAKRSLKSGSQGKVYLAEHKKGGEFALKIFDIREPVLGNYRFTGGPQAGEIDTRAYEQAKELYDQDYGRFLREGDLKLDINHPNIGPIIESGRSQASGFMWLAMPFYNGGDLKGVLDKGRLTREQVLSYAQDLASGLDALHERKIIHRDLKPENLMLHDGRLVIIDFGMAKDRGDKEAPALTVVGQGLGTPYYMSPEQAVNSVTADPQADQYSFGILLFEMLTGQLPMDRDVLPLEAVKIHLDGSLKPLREIDPSQSTEVEAVISKMTNKNDLHRYESVKEAFKAFKEAYLSSNPT